MAHTKTPKPTAAENRKAADDALDDRIKARQAKIKDDAAKNPIPAATPDAKPATPSALPFVPTSPESAKPEKRARKPREAKPKAEPDAELADLIKNAQEKAVKAALKEQAEQHKAILKGTVDKTTHDKLVKQAYEDGIATGKKQALAGVKAALKGA